MVLGASLPIDVLRVPVQEALRAGPVVVSSPTGSGKSTEVPRWCAAVGRVVVIEPRRVACRSLASRVAELEGSALGARVGYVVRDDAKATSATQIVFATPGIVLRDAALLESAATVILDEFHERSLDTDLLLALLLRRAREQTEVDGRVPRQGLIVMSATLDGERVANHIGGVHLTGEGRTHPVDLRYLGSGAELPDSNDLVARVQAGLRRSESDPGDVLVFLPGKAEIEACARALAEERVAVIPLHGGLSLDEQRRAFEPAGKRKVILATNVAETSITLPGVGVVIDAGLARQTRFADGRASLVLAPIAEDSAAQRAGRAGRTSAGVCYRLWSARARLAPSTLPEIHRASLVPLVLSAAAWGARVDELPLLDAPKAYALDAARAELVEWGLLDQDGRIEDRGQSVFSLPVDPFLARLLVEARATGCIEDAIDVVSVLAVGRPLFLPGAPPDDASEDLRIGGSDVVAFIRAVRVGRAEAHRLSHFVLTEARQIRERLRRVHALPPAARPPEVGRERSIDEALLVRTALHADARVAHVARRRGGRQLFANGAGPELEVGRESALARARDLEAIIVFDAVAFGVGRDARRLVTCGAPVKLAEVARAGIGEERISAVRREGGRVVATIERVLADSVLAARDEVPQRELARQAVAMLFLRGSLFREALALTKERLPRHALAAQLAKRGHPAGVPTKEPVTTLEDWVHAKLRVLGVESGEDLALLSASDLTVPEVPFEVRAQLDREFPPVVVTGDAVYRADYDLEKSEVVLRQEKGGRDAPPPIAYLPRFEGLRICVDGPRGFTVVRPRG